jgi:hypothetical protein
MKGMKIMYGYQGKIAGIVISAVGLLLIISEKLHPWSILPTYTPDQQHSLFRWIALLGLLTIAYSKEKDEDDRAAAIRLKALQIAFLLQQAVMLAFALTMSTANESIDTSILFILAAMGTVMHLLLFHVGLYFDDLWDFDDRSRLPNPLKNLSKNKWSLLVYLLLAGILLLSLTIFA